MQNKYIEYKEVSYQICKGMQACVMIDDLTEGLDNRRFAYKQELNNRQIMFFI